MNKPAIEVKNLSKSYVISHQKEVRRKSLLQNVTTLLRKPLGGGPNYTKETFWALDDVSFEVQEGEIFGVLGKNGSGKSTLLKTLSRIVDPTNGEVIMRGRVASLLEVGTGFHPELTGRENIFLNGSMLGMSRSEIIRKFDEIVEFSEVEKFLDTPVKFYSSGMYVRLAFSVAAHLEPDILILDEVLSVGDIQFQKKSLDKMLSVAKEGKTILFVSHSMTSVEDLCTRAMWINKGKVAYIGKTDEVIAKYQKFTGTESEKENHSSHKALSKIKQTYDKSKKSTAFQLSDVDERQGNGRVMFEKLEIINTIKKDQKLKINIWLKNRTVKTFTKPRLSFSILNHAVSREALSIISNENVNQQLELKPGLNFITLEIHDINLVTGKYTLNSFLAKDSSNQEIFDWIENAAELTIPEYDFYKVDRLPAYPGKVINLKYIFNQEVQSDNS